MMSRVVPALVVLGIAVGASALAGRAQKEDKGGELIATITATWTGRFVAKSNDAEVQDTITVVWTARLRRPVPAGAKPWEVATDTTDWTWTVSGGGRARAGGYSESWTYQVKSQRREPGSSMWPMYLEEASYRVVVPDFSEVEIVPVTTGDRPSPSGNVAQSIEQTLAYAFIAPAIGSARNTLALAEARAGLDERFRDQLKGTFDPRRLDVGGAGSPSVEVNETQQGAGSRSASLRVAYEWNVVTEPANVEAVLIPTSPDYDRWEPFGRVDDPGSFGTYLEVRVVLRRKDRPGEQPRQTAKFTFDLLDVSREEGVCLNWPKRDSADTEPDLGIPEEQNEGLTVLSGELSADSAEGLRESVVYVHTYDYGAYGRLRVTAQLDDGTRIVAHLEKDPTKTELSIPRDDNANHIADVWEGRERRDVGLPSTEAGSDEDSFPSGDGDKGDGLSLYEEYRGFAVQGEHVRTHPMLKDLFIHDAANIGPGYFSQSNLSYHLLAEREMGNDPDKGIRNPYVINVYRGFANLGKQHILYLSDQRLTGLLGIARCVRDTPSQPRNCWPVEVDVAKCKEIGEDQLKQIIAHELAHAVRVFHHGDIDYNVHQVWALQPNGSWKEEPSGERKVAAQGGQHSGVEECIMRYGSAAHYYEWDQGFIRWRKGSADVRGSMYGTFEAPGTIFCTQMVGTGVNAPRAQPIFKAGDATLGRCQRQFCVNDLKH